MKLKAHKLTAALLASSAITLSSCLPEAPYLERDVRDDVFYFVMPDRFENGDLSNDLGGLVGDSFETGFDPYNKGMYHGGDMNGLESRLDYLKDMGITAIWMTPILKNQAVQGSPEAFSSAYHGYWTLDFTQIDPHLGSNDDLKSLIDAAHDRNMKVYFDIITNHTADVIKYEECHDADGYNIVDPCPYVSLEEKAAGNGLTPFIPAGKENLKVPEWLNDPKYYNNQGDSTFSGENSIYGDFVGLDDLDTTKQEVIDGMIDIFTDLVSEFKPDGFRIDTVKHVNIEFWQQFSPALEAHAKAEGIPNFFMFGEVYDGNPQFLSQFTTVGKLPSVLDFGIQGAASSVFGNNGASTALSGLFEQDDVYTDHDSDATTLMNFAGNHDMGRIGMFIQNGNPDATDEELVARMKLANAMMFFARGIPVIYYGDEQGFTGDGNDQDAREDMFPSLVDIYNDNNLIGTSATTAQSNFDDEHPLYLAIAEYSDVYKSHSTLRYGEHVNRYSEEGGLYAFSRVAEDNVEYLVVFNAETNPRSLTLPASSRRYLPVVGGERLRADGDGNITVDIAPLDFAIYKAARPARISPKTDFSIDGVIDGAAVAGRVDVSLSLEKDGGVLPTYTATFEASTDGGFTYDLVAVDNAAPYRLFWQTGELADGTDVILRATLDNGRGKVTTQEVSMVIDSRVPESVTVDYENGNARDVLYVSDQNGGLQGPIALDNGTFSFAWDENDDSQLLVFINQNGDEFAIDKPVQISRSNIVALSEENADGNLEAFIYVNNAGDVANIDNDSGFVPVELPLDAAAAAPYGEDFNVRGGLNGWATDPMTYAGNQTYKLQRVVDQGDVEFKFADSTWSNINIGGNVTSNGLVAGSNPGNLVHTFPATALYNFYLISTQLDGEDVILYFMDQEVGPVGETLYVKGSMNGWSEDDAMTYLGDNLYSGTLDVDAGQANFKIANANWSWERTVNGEIALDTVTDVVAGGGNSVLDAEHSANYTFNYVFGDETLEITSDYVSPFDPGLTVVFKTPDTWTAAPIYIHYWNVAGVPGTEWPGLPATDLGDGWYSYQFPDGVAAANVIFHNNMGDQTGDATARRESDGCLVDGAWQDSCPPYLGEELPGFTVRFEAPESWSNVNVYYWDNGADAVNWPGVPATPLYQNWYTFTFPAGVSESNIIFNAGSGSPQTTDMVRAGDGCFVGTDDAGNGGSWVDSCTVSMTVYFENQAGWVAPLNVHYWDNGVANTDWPGMELTDLGNNWYSYQFPDGVFASNLIFNDSTPGTRLQTENLYREGDGCYDLTANSWSDTCAHP